MMNLTAWNDNDNDANGNSRALLEEPLLRPEAKTDSLIIAIHDEMEQEEFKGATETHQEGSIDTHFQDFSSFFEEFTSISIPAAAKQNPWLVLCLVIVLECILTFSIQRGLDNHHDDHVVMVDTQDDHVVLGCLGLLVGLVAVTAGLHYLHNKRRATIQITIEYAVEKAPLWPTALAVLVLLGCAESMENEATAIAAMAMGIVLAAVVVHKIMLRQFGSSSSTTTATSTSAVTMIPITTTVKALFARHGWRRVLLGAVAAIHVIMVVLDSGGGNSYDDESWYTVAVVILAAVLLGGRQTKAKREDYEQQQEQHDVENDVSKSHSHSPSSATVVDALTMVKKHKYSIGQKGVMMAILTVPILWQSTKTTWFLYNDEVPDPWWLTLPLCLVLFQLFWQAVGEAQDAYEKERPQAQQVQEESSSKQLQNATTTSTLPSRYIVLDFLRQQSPLGRAGLLTAFLCMCLCSRAILYSIMMQQQNAFGSSLSSTVLRTSARAPVAVSSYH